MGHPCNAETRRIISQAQRAPVFEIGGVKHKVCSRCEKPKPLSEFGIRKELDLDGNPLRNFRCNPCNADYQTEYRQKNPEQYTLTRRKIVLRRNYHMTMEQWVALFESQGCVCAVCGADNPRSEGRWWCIDHDHSCCPTAGKSCGKCVRGIVCHPCNKGMGCFSDDPALLIKAAKFVQEHKALLI